MALDYHVGASNARGGVPTRIGSPAMERAEILEANSEATDQDAKRQKRDAPRLRLEKQTIRTLSGVELGVVGGGSVPTQTCKCTIA
jgi:hypothetical protein